MSEVKIKVPSIATIGVTGPTQCGKSIVMHRLKEILEKEMGATVVINSELQQDFSSNDYKALDNWQRQMIKDTVWVLAE